MSDTVLKASIAGVSGRLGRAIAHELLTQAKAELTGGMVSANSVDRGADIGELAGLGFRGVETTVRLEDAIGSGDVLIDATLPDVTVVLAERLAQTGGLAMVTGTTGFTEDQQARLEAAGQSIAILQASNFSLGVAVVETLISRAAELLNPDVFDLEIVESHHKFKADAPSGTAISLGKAAAQARGQDFDEVAEFSRPRQSGLRMSGKIGFNAVRGGGVVGDHTAMFLASMEEISIGHRAYDRIIFARGAVQAARWIKDKPAGLYTMQDVVGA